MAKVEFIRVGNFATVQEIIGRFSENPRADLFDERPYTGVTPDLVKAWGNSAYQEKGYVVLSLRGDGVILRVRPADFGKADTSTYYAVFQSHEPLVLRHFTLTDGDLLEPPVMIPDYIMQHVQKFQGFIAGITEE